MADQSPPIPAADDTPSILSMQDITKRFPGVIALDGVTFDVHPGEVHGLVGENGAGKSTLMNIMSGVYTDYEGRLLLNGEPVRFHNPRDAQNAGIVMIHQELNLVPELTVYENIFLGREHKTFGAIINRRSMRRTAQKLMFDLGLDIDPNCPINQMRVGQRQLVEIAKALNLNSRIIIMDEPTSALSDAEVAYLFNVIRGLRAHDVAVIYISHRLDEIFAIADRISVLRDGRVVGTSLAADISRQELINRMVGRSLDVLYPKEDVEIGGTLLRIENLSLHQGRAQILDNISLHVQRGEIVGVAGLMGAGRTQLLETIFGVYPHSQVSGTIWFGGQERAIHSPKEAIEMGIGLIAEDRKGQSLVLEQSVTENATLAALREFFYALNIINHGAERKAVSGIVNDLNIKTPSIRTMVANLSGGNQQKVVIAKFLLANIKLFLLDEPTRGIDVGAKAEVYHLIGELAQQGTGFLLVSSELPELLAICDRIVVLCDGRLTGEFAREHFDQAAIMEAATRFTDTESLPA
ncbi:sugar ABC transporter ATP-binding protein [Aggregatilinea lenta]|uniref:sugar ABC transporter ATP-binding protein n=1 Tax=Aggregatilinea lenta TaxID=913108 RepID=UPI001EE98692|nr:sugar ABC transporter ATP-binding protein [Aggregatilinea lenta]